MYSIGEIKNGFPVLERKDRKTILLLSDDLRFNSGVGTIAKEIVYETAHRFNWIHVGGAGRHPNLGDVSKMDVMFSNSTGIPDAALTIHAVNGFGTPDLIRKILNENKVDCILHFTDPRFWVWLYQMSGELKSKVPLAYLSLWDDTPVPYYNYPLYKSSDLIMSINRQSHQFCQNILKDEHINIYKEHKYEKKKILLDYVPHGINGNVYKPVTEIELTEFRKKMFGDKQFDYVVLYNNRNLRRKQVGDVMLAFNSFVNNLNEEDKEKCVLYMHTATVDEAGTDIGAIMEDLFPDLNIFVDERKYTQQELNYMYNIADVTINIACNEGFGLSSAESIMAGTMVINNVTGGLQDHMRFEENGKWIELKDNFMTNHSCVYETCGEWAIPVFPATRSLSGSVTIPYLFEDRCDFEDVSYALYRVYKMDRKTRKQHALKGREWLLSEESRMSSAIMNRVITKDLEFLVDNWVPYSKFELFNALEERIISSYSGII